MSCTGTHSCQVVLRVLVTSCCNTATRTFLRTPKDTHSNVEKLLCQLTNTKLSKTLVSVWTILYRETGEFCLVGCIFFCGNQFFLVGRGDSDRSGGQLLVGLLNEKTPRVTPDSHSALQAVYEYFYMNTSISVY